MINRLSISNYLLIDSLDIQLDKGLNIITGETGAGKSILMGALELLTGERADLKSLNRQDEKCVIEGWFLVSNPNLTQIFEDADIEPEPETIIRREILPGGKSRAFVNDSPVTLDVLKRIGNQLIDVHGQQDTLLLATAENQVQTFDILADTGKEKSDYQVAFRNWRKARKELTDLKQNLEKEIAELGFRQFVFNELEQANLKDGEQEELENQLELLKNSEDIKLRVNQSLAILEGETDLASNIKQAAANLEKLASFSTSIGELATRLKSSWLELKDIVAEISDLEAGLHHDPEKIAELDERLSLLYSLQKKHRKNSTAELIEWRDSLSGQLQGFSRMEEEIEAKTNEVEYHHTDVLQTGKILSEKRKSHAGSVAKNLLNLIAEMGMAKARFEVEILDQAPSESGLDKITFRFSANPGLPLAELKNAASGGEFSRLMLAFKCLLAERQEMPTLIFDEIDTGISGEIAARVGKIMKQLADRHQVISITHSAQLAAQSDAHWFVYKKQEETSTATGVRRLSDTEKLEEIAKMISGSSISSAAIEAARELIGG